MYYSYFIIFFLLFSFQSSGQTGNDYYLVTGTYTSGKSEGIYVFDFNTETAESQLVSTTKTDNPSYLTVSTNEKYIYAVNETARGQLSAFSFNKSNGQLTLLNQQTSNGAHPCYITADRSGKWVITGNYSSGTISVNKTNADGYLAFSGDSVEHFGSSVDLSRQESPHVHATVLNKDNKYLYVPDLGIDRLMIYRFDKKSGKLKEGDMPFVMTKPGAGPRHFEIHPNGKFAFLMEELTGSVSAYHVLKNGGLSLYQNISALPRDFLGTVGSADIHVSLDGKFLYCSNRGESNTIGILNINGQSGLLTWVAAQSTLGKTPRNFNFDPSGRFLLVANQNSDKIVIFERNKETGLLTDTGKRITVPNPVCIKWISKK